MFDTYNEYRISVKEWNKVKRIYENCLNEKIEIQENFEKLEEDNEFLTKECTSLAIENKNLEIENAKLQKELEETRKYLEWFMTKSSELSDLVRKRIPEVTIRDL